MATNDLSKVIPTLFAQGLKVLRSNCVMPRSINNSYSTEAKQKGQNILIPIASDIGVTDVVPGPYAPDPAAVAPRTASITLDQWKEAAFTLTEQDVANAINGIAPLELEAAAKAIAESVNAQIFSKYVKIPTYVGTAGVTPFSSLNDAVNARQQLGRQLAPLDPRFMILNPDAEGQALSLPAFNAQYSSGDRNVMLEGDIGRKFGFDFKMDQQVPTHLSTALTAGAATVNGAVSAGSSVISIAKATNASPLVVGDILVIAGDKQTYAVVATTTLAVGNTNVAITPALKVSKAGGEAITLVGSHAVNLAFHRDAFGFASRTLENMSALGEDGRSFTQVDPVSKLAMRLTFREEHHRTRFAFDILYGVDVVRPELATRVLG